MQKTTERAYVVSSRSNGSGGLPEDSRSSTRHGSIRHSSLATRHSPLATRHSSLATRHSPLATRHSPLVTRHSRGFTMVELLVSISILVILMGLLFLPMMTALDIYHRGQADAEAQNSVRQAMDQMQKDLPKAMIVYPNDSYAGPTPTVTSRIDFVSPQLDSLGQPILPLQPQVTSSTPPSPTYVTYYVRLNRPAEASDVRDSDGDGIPDQLTLTSSTSPNLHVLYRAEFTLPPGASGLTDPWRTYSGSTAKPPYSSGAENPAFSLEDPTTQAGLISHVAITPKQDSDVSMLTFSLEYDDPTDTTKVTGVTINMLVSRYDVAKGGRVSAQLKSNVRLSNTE